VEGEEGVRPPAEERAHPLREEVGVRAVGEVREAGVRAVGVVLVEAQVLAEVGLLGDTWEVEGRRVLRKEKEGVNTEN